MKKAKARPAPAPAPAAASGAAAAAPVAYTRKQRERAQRKRRYILGISPVDFFTIVMALIALFAFSYSTAANWVFQYNKSKIVSSYAQEVEHVDPSKAEQLKQAELYNQALQTGVLLGANEHVPLGTGTLADGTTVAPYDEQLKADSTGLMARVRVPAIDVDLPIYHGTSDAVLLEGVGHLEGSSLPIGGEGTHAVLTAHRGLASATLFSNLDKVKIGDEVIIETFGEILQYKVINTRVVEPEETQSLKAEPGKDLVTLVTCTPLGINSHRILVTAERVPTTDAKAGQKSELPHFPWWIVIDCICLALICAYAVFAFKRGKRERLRTAQILAAAGQSPAGAAAAADTAAAAALAFAPLNAAPAPPAGAAASPAAAAVAGAPTSNLDAASAAAPSSVPAPNFADAPDSLVDAAPVSAADSHSRGEAAPNAAGAVEASTPAEVAAADSAPTPPAPTSAPPAPPGVQPPPSAAASSGSGSPPTRDASKLELDSPYRE